MFYTSLPNNTLDIHTYIHVEMTLFASIDTTIMSGSIDTMTLSGSIDTMTLSSNID